MLHGGARVPRAYLGFEDDSNGLSKNSLVSQDLRFARMIRTLRRPIVNGYTRLGNIHLALKGKDPSQYDVRFHMSKISSLENEVNAEVFQLQTQAATSFIDLCDKLGVERKEIADLVFRKILSNFSDAKDMARLSAAISSGGELSSALGLEGVVPSGGQALFESVIKAQPSNEKNTLLSHLKAIESIQGTGHTSLVESYTNECNKWPAMFDGITPSQKVRAGESENHDAVKLRAKIR
jgi:hypothetical protein